MNVLDLFSGIGGFSLGLERCGMRTVAFCEINRYCACVLAQRWPEVPIFPDVRALDAAHLAARGVKRIDLICGGFPCQDISMAGTGTGIGGKRSRLWIEFARLVREIRPSYVLVENVAALLGRGLGAVLGDLVEIGYDAQWHCIPAAYVGAPHRRDRVWIVAYPHSGGREVLRLAQYLNVACDAWDLAHRCGEAGRGDGTTADDPHAHRIDARCELDATADGQRADARTAQSAWQPVSTQGHWATEPNVGRVAHGIPHRVDRLRALGNAAVPQVVQMLGKAVQAHAFALGTAIAPQA